MVLYIGSLIGFALIALGCWIMYDAALIMQFLPAHGIHFFGNGWLGTTICVLLYWGTAVLIASPLE